MMNSSHLSKYELRNSNSADYWKADVNYKIQLFPFSDVYSLLGKIYQYCSYIFKKEFLVSRSIVKRSVLKINDISLG